MVILQGSPETLTSKMKSCMKKIVARPGGRKVDKAKPKHNKPHSGYLGDDERAQLTRTFSPPLSRPRTFPLVISHQSDETLHLINSDNCDIGSAGSSHSSSGFNESMLEALERPLHNSTAYRPFNIDSPIVSELDFPIQSDEVMKTNHKVFEGVGGRDVVEPMDLKDHHQLVKSLTHKNKVLTQERRDLDNQLEQQEDMVEKLELDLKRIRREKKDVERLRKEEGGRLRMENKELEHSLEKLREQRMEVENRIEQMERDEAVHQMQIQEVRLQLQHQIEEVDAQKEKNNELMRLLENKDRQLNSLADSFKYDADLNMATQLRLEELNKENAELQSLVIQLKTDKEFLAGTLTKVTCELSRWRQGVPLSPTHSTNSSVTSPLVSYHTLLPVTEEGDTIDELLNQNKDALHCEDIDSSRYIDVTDLLEEREKLIQKNDLLEIELEDMRKLMCFVAPQHYIEDDNIQFEEDQFSMRTKIPSYSSLDRRNMGKYSESLANTPYSSRGKENLEHGVVEIPPYTCISPINQTPETSDTELSCATLAEIPEMSEWVCCTTENTEFISRRDMTESPEMVLDLEQLNRHSDDDVSRIPTQIKAEEENIGGFACQDNSHWEPEISVEDMISQDTLDHIKWERDQLEFQLQQLQNPRWRGWVVHLAGLVLLLFLLLSLVPLYSHAQCKHTNHGNIISWGVDFLSYKVIHLRDRQYNVPH